MSMYRVTAEGIIIIILRLIHIDIIPWINIILSRQHLKQLNEFISNKLNE